MNSDKLPFLQRLGLTEGKPIYDDFPQSAIVGLIYLFGELDEHNYLRHYGSKSGWYYLLREFHRTSRMPDFDIPNHKPHRDWLTELLIASDWHQIYTFCERIYNSVLVESGHMEFDYEWIVDTSLAEVRSFYSTELNTILAEENIGYQLVDGEFQRRGRAQTQKNIQRAGTVLGDERFLEVRRHYNKAQKHFEEFPFPDSVNCVKESLNALEACSEILSGKSSSKGFAKVINELKGNGARQIPPPIAEGMIKLYGYRGSGKGVAHANLEGNKVTDLEAELVLSLTAAYVTYLVDLLSDNDDIPF